MDSFRARRSSEVRSPERARVCLQPRLKPLRKVQIVYYLSRNGQLEHPHYMEIFLSSTPTNPHLRLKDFLNRLTALRGKSMPSHYSWSSKRIYKTGYVWNDLAEDDVIYPTEGAEYVLKGSELIEGCTEKPQQLHFRNNQKFYQKRQLPCPSSGNAELEADYDEEEEVIHEVEDDNNGADNTSDTSSSAAHPSRCSRGVSSTKNPQEEIQKAPNTPQLITLNDLPPSTTSSSNISEKVIQQNVGSKRFDENQPIEIDKTKPCPSRTSILFQLIACGSSVGLKSKYLHGLAQAKPSGLLKDKSNCSCGSSFRSGVSKSEIKAVEEEMMISFMSENPRFANLQSQEKEYFSGSIVMSMTTENRVADESVMKRSNSYNEERNKKIELHEAAEKMERELEEKEKIVKGKCIPRKKYSATAKTTKKMTT